MKRRAHACQNDENQPGIVAALRKVNAYVHILGTPYDLLVAWRGLWFVLEVKDGSKVPSAQKLKPLQVETLAKIKAAAPVYIVRDPQEALAAIGAIDYPEVSL